MVLQIKKNKNAHTCTHKENKELTTTSTRKMEKCPLPKGKPKKSTKTMTISSALSLHLCPKSRSGQSFQSRDTSDKTANKDA